jgi:hypothetical protein
MQLELLTDCFTFVGEYRYWIPRGVCRSAEFPVDNTFDGSLDDLLKSGSRDEPMIFFK